MFRKTLKFGVNFVVCYNYIMKYTESIVGSTKYCYACHMANAEVHHIFYGPYRSLSEKYGLKIGLCADHHRGKHGVHGINRDLDHELKQIAQKAFERKYGHDKFMEVFTRDYSE